jgi:nicotinamide-nucleotide adenylyltransferase
MSSAKPVPVGVVHGRFQVLHHDHLAYIRAGRARCRHLVIGITNPDPTLTRAERADPARGAPLANPLTYFERQMLLRAALDAAGIPPVELSVVPLPISCPDLYRYYVPPDAVHFLTIYDDWGREKLARFERLGLRTELLWQRPAAEKGQTASEIRARMLRGEPWGEFVAPGTRALLEAWRIPQRLQALRSAAEGRGAAPG